MAMARPRRLAAAALVLLVVGALAVGAAAGPTTLYITVDISKMVDISIVSSFFKTDIVRRHLRVGEGERGEGRGERGKDCSGEGRDEPRRACQGASHLLTSPSSRPSTLFNRRVPSMCCSTLTATRRRTRSLST